MIVTSPPFSFVISQQMVRGILLDVHNDFVILVDEIIIIILIIPLFQEMNVTELSLGGVVAIKRVRLST